MQILKIFIKLPISDMEWIAADGSLFFVFTWPSHYNSELVSSLDIPSKPH